MEGTRSPGCCSNHLQCRKKLRQMHSRMIVLGIQGWSSHLLCLFLLSRLQYLPVCWLQYDCYGASTTSSATAGSSYCRPQLLELNILACVCVCLSHSRSLAIVFVSQSLVLCVVPVLVTCYLLTRSAKQSLFRTVCFRSFIDLLLFHRFSGFLRLDCWQSEQRRLPLLASVSSSGSEDS